MEPAKPIDTMILQFHARTTLRVSVAALAIAGAVFASDTNVTYLPVDPRGYVGNTARVKAYAEQMEAAKGRPESRPAELDPEGHWGTVTAGVQISIRLSTNVFALGQPIEATVTLRNVTTNSMALRSAGPWTIDFSGFNESKQALAVTNRALWYIYSGSANVGLPARRQITYQFKLNDILDLREPGRYYLAAKRVKDKWPGLPEVQSGTAEITVVEPVRQ